MCRPTCPRSPHRAPASSPHALRDDARPSAGRRRFLPCRARRRSRPDGGLYMPERIEPWSRGGAVAPADPHADRDRLPGVAPAHRGELDATTHEAVVVEALNFPIPLVEVEPGIFALELFHGPTLAFKDIGARTMARLMALARHRRRSAHGAGRHIGRYRQRGGATPFTASRIPASSCSIPTAASVPRRKRS